MTGWERTEWDPQDNGQWDPHEDDHAADFDDQYESDVDDADRSETVACSNCGAEVYEDSPRCAVCGEYVSRSRSPFVGRPNWYIILAIAGILVTMVLLATGGHL